MTCPTAPNCPHKTCNSRPLSAARRSQQASGADGKSYGDIFELRLPAAWNGRLLFQGGGGLDGIVQPAIGAGGLGERPALARGYAVVSTDGGHAADPKAPMADGSFGSDPAALADYDTRSTQTCPADAAKKIVLRRYGQLPTHSYFRGCSNGGREGLIAVQRYPTYFDGVIGRRTRLPSDARHDRRGLEHHAVGRPGATKFARRSHRLRSATRGSWRSRKVRRARRRRQRSHF